MSKGFSVQECDATNGLIVPLPPGTQKLFHFVGMLFFAKELAKLKEVLLPDSNYKEYEIRRLS
jgi:hypothetical protein